MKKHPKFLVATCFLCSIMLTGCGEKEINLEDYLSVSYSGSNGYATAHIDFDYLGFGDAISSNSKENLSIFELAAAADNVKVNVDGNTDDNLSNGDQFTVSFEWNTDSAKSLGLKYIGENKEFTVEGLEDVKEIDPFENLDVTFSGISPYGNANYTNNRTNDLLHFNYLVEPMNNLKNGDTVKLYINDSDPQKKALQNGYLLTATEKEFVVEGLPYYISKLEELPSDMLDKMKKQSEDVIAAEAASLYTDPLLGYEFLGNYFLVKKESAFLGIFSNNNYCCCVYKIHANCKGEDFYYYYYVEFQDILALEDGSCSVDLTNYIVPVNRFKFVDFYYYVGYQDLDSLFNDCVTRNIADYKYESTVTE